MNAEAWPTDGRSPSLSTRMWWLTSTGVSAASVMNLSSVVVCTLMSEPETVLPDSTVLQNLGMVELVSDANTQIALADVVWASPVP